jgi:hypothetical protein
LCSRTKIGSDSEESTGERLNSFGPNMSLAKELLKQGERDVVLEFFTRCGTFWESGTDRLQEWTSQVQKGVIPDFGANLRY